MFEYLLQMINAVKIKVVSTFPQRVYGIIGGSEYGCIVRVSVWYSAMNVILSSLLYSSTAVGQNRDKLASLCQLLDITGD